MGQHDFDISSADANTGLAMRAAINAALQALAGCSSGASAPTTPYAYQLWADTTTGILKMRNAANTAWINILDLASGGIKNILLGSDADGDMYFRSSGALARFAKGAANTKLFMNAGATGPEWALGGKEGVFTYDLSITGADSVSSVGFKPSFGIFIAHIDGLAALSIGFSDGTSNGTGLYYQAADNVTYGGAWGLVSSGGNYAYPSALSWNADGFDYTKAKVSSPTGTGRIKYLLFR